MNEFELMKYKVSSDGIDIEKYMEDCLLGGHKYLLKDGSKYEDFGSGRRTMRIVRELLSIFNGIDINMCFLFSAIYR